MKKKNIFLSMLLFAATSLSIITVSADSIFPPEPYTIPLKDKNKILYITPMGQEQNDKNKDYPKSGLYYNETPLRNIYYFDDYLNGYSSYLHESSFVYSDDGAYVVHIPWAQNRPWSHQSRQFTDETDGEAIIIYKNGALLKSYTVGELIKDKTKVEFSISHVNWENFVKRNFNAKKNILTVTTKDDIVISLDITTGDIIKEAGKNKYLAFAIIGVCAICAITLAAIFLYKRKKTVREEKL